MDRLVPPVDDLPGAGTIGLLADVETMAARHRPFHRALLRMLEYVSPEAFPAQIRGTACGVASFWGRLFGIISPLIAQHLYAKSRDDKGDVNSVLYLAGGVTLGCVITTTLLPSKMLKK